MRQLSIICSNRKAGVLKETDDRQYIFVYDESYLNSDAPSIAVSFPKRKEEYSSPYMFPFFSNLLPEGVNKHTICRQKHIDEDDLMALLAVFAGKDFIGNIGVENMNE